MTQEKQVNVNDVILNKLANEIGVLKARVIQVETYNEVLVQKLQEYEAKEQGESVEEVEAEIVE